MLHNRPILKSRRKELRNGATPAEKQLWSILQNSNLGGFKFRRQVILNGFIVDFACLEARLVLEVDGATHSTEVEIARDAARSVALRYQGYAILRFANDEVFHNLDGVLETIRLKLLELRPRIDERTFEGGATPVLSRPPQKGRG